jgi:hypothetical protein
MIFCCHCLTIGCCCICGCLASLFCVATYVAGIASLLVVGAYVAALPHYSAVLHMWLALPHYWSLMHMWLLWFTIMHDILLSLPHYWLLLHMWLPCLTIGRWCICGCFVLLFCGAAYVAGIASLLGVAAYVAGIASLLHHYFTNGCVLQFYTKEEIAQMLKLHDSLWTDAIKQATGNTNSKLDRVRDDIIYCALLVVAMTIACRYLTSCKKMKLSTKQRSRTCKQKFALCTKIKSKYKVIPMPHKQLPNNQCWVAGRVESLTTSHEELQNLMALERGEWQKQIKEHTAQFQEFSQ